MKLYAVQRQCPKCKILQSELWFFIRRFEIYLNNTHEIYIYVGIFFRRSFEFLERIGNDYYINNNYMRKVRIICKLNRHREINVMKLCYVSYASYHYLHRHYIIS